MQQQTIKFSSRGIELPVLDTYLHVIYLLLIFALVKYIFGNQINQFYKYLKSKFKELRSRQKISDWTAECKNRRNISQKQDTKNIDLKGQYIRSIKFTVVLDKSTKFWRTGFMMGNEKNFANNIVDTENAITIHAGSLDSEENNLLPIWKYYGDFKRENPDSSGVILEDKSNIEFSLTINDSNFMTVRVEDDVVFAQKIKPDFRRRFFLKAWADDKSDYNVIFKDIEYSLWS